MANVQHNALSGADLHESKGAASAASGQVAIANGSGNAIFGQLQWTQIGGKPVIVTVFNSDVAATSNPIIKTYTVAATSGIFTVPLTGFATVHNAWATVISGGTTLVTSAMASVASITSVQVQGTVILPGAAGNTLGTSQSVRVTVIGV